MLERFQSAPAIRGQIAAGYEYYLVSDRGRHAGYFALVPARTKRAAQLSKIYVRHARRGRGLGKAIIAFAEAVLRREGHPQAVADGQPAQRRFHRLLRAHGLCQVAAPCPEDRSRLCDGRLQDGQADNPGQAPRNSAGVQVNPGPFDLLFQNARVIDGAGSPPFRADVGIVGDRITAMGPLSGAHAARRIDVSGKVLCPGFIDVHVHSELDLLSGAVSEARIRQGVTTDIMSADGFSLAALSPDRMGEMCDYLAPFYGPRLPSWNWRTYAEYLERFDRRVALNVLPQVPFNLFAPKRWAGRPGRRRATNWRR